MSSRQLPSIANECRVAGAVGTPYSEIFVFVSLLQPTVVADVVLVVVITGGGAKQFASR